MRDQILLAAVLEVNGLTGAADEMLREVLPECETAGIPQPLIEGGHPIQQIVSRLIDSPETWHPRTRTLDWMHKLFQPHAAS